MESRRRPSAEASFSVDLAAVVSSATDAIVTWTTAEGPFFGAIIRDVSERKRAEDELRAVHEALADKTQQLEALSAKLAKYLSRQLYQSIFEGRTEVRVTPHRKMLTVFFSDIQGFTELTDSMEAEPLSQLLNEYLGEMATIASQHGGWCCERKKSAWPPTHPSGSRPGTS